MSLVQVSKCSQWEYDQSEFWDTAVTDNDWVCDKVTRHVSRVALKQLDTVGDWQQSGWVTFATVMITINMGNNMESGVMFPVTLSHSP